MKFKYDYPLKDRPLLSVVMPFHNRQDTLSEAVKALSEQNLADCEVILVNDASDDNSVSSIADLVEADDRIRLVTMLPRQDGTPNGPGDARNYGMCACTGQYIYFPDADDVVLPGAFAKMTAELQNTDADVLVFGYRRVVGEKVTGFSHQALTLSAQEGKKKFAFYAKGQECVLAGSAWNRCFRLNFFWDNNLRFPSMKRNEDEVFLMQYLDHAESVKVIPDVLYEFRPMSFARALKELPDNYMELVDDFKAVRMGYGRLWGIASDPDFIAFAAGEYFGKMELAARVAVKKTSGMMAGIKEIKQVAAAAMKGLDEMGPLAHKSLEGRKTYKAMKSRNWLLCYMAYNR